MQRVEIDISDVDEEIQDNVDQFLKKVAIKLTNKLKETAPVDQGRLRNSIQILERKEGEIVVGVNVSYAKALQEGTRGFTPPLTPLLNWAERKLNDREAGYAVRKKIQKEGIEKNEFVTRGIRRLEQEY